LLFLFVFSFFEGGKEGAQRQFIGVRAEPRHHADTDRRGQRTVAEVPAAPALTIDSPLVGTFYHASSPETPPFVKVGDKVCPDSVIGIIEAMKVMNEVKAEKAGVIKEILVENGQPVEYGEALFIIE